MKQITCPHCDGTGVDYLLINTEHGTDIVEVTCPVCGGDRVILVDED